MKRLLAGTMLALTAACAQGASTVSTKGDAMVNVEMRGSHFFPASVDVRRGQDITFRFKNRDRIPHEAFIGTRAMQMQHEAEMRMIDKQGHGSMMDEGGMVTVQPGKTATVMHRFTRSSLIGCHQPGHYAAGMVMTINVR